MIGIERWARTNTRAESGETVGGGAGVDPKQSSPSSNANGLANKDSVVIGMAALLFTKADRGTSRVNSRDLRT